MLASLRDDRNNIYKTFREAKGSLRGLGPLRKAPGEPLTDDPKEKAKLLNDQYKSVFTNLSDWKKSGDEKDGETMGNFQYTQNEVFKKLWKLKPKTSCGKNGVSNWMLRAGAPQLVWPLTHLFNWMLRSREMPKEGMVLKIVPVDKGKRDKTIPAHHRPVALGCCIMKLKESLFADRFEEAMKKIGFWHESQYGFTRGVGREENLATEN